MKKYIFAFIYLLISIFSWYQLYNEYTTQKENYQQQISSWSNISFTGNTFSWIQNSTGILVNTWVLVNTGITIEVTKTELQKFKDMKSGWFLRTFNPPLQPTFTTKLSYQIKSNKLNEYLKANNFYFRNTSKLEDGYIYIKLAKPIRNFDIFLYFHDSGINWNPMSGKLAKEDNLITGTWANQEFLYKLDDISIYRFYDGKKTSFDWLNSTLSDTNRVHFVWWYTTTSDGNYIKEIIITGK